MKRILITGANGYIGNCLFHFLKGRFKIIGIDQELINTWMEICNTADMAKYAKQIPDIDQYHEEKINIINLLKSFHHIRIQSESLIWNV